MKEARIAACTLTLGLLGAATAQGMPTVNVVSADKGYQLPAQVQSGYTQFNFTNSGTQPAEMQIFKLKNGVNADTLKRALSALAIGMQSQQGDAAALEAAVINAAEMYGGAQQLPPKVNYRMIVNLEPGNYIISTVSTNNDEKNPKALADLGFFQPFTVVKGNNTAVAPKATYTAQLADFALALPPTQVTAGQHMWEVVNHGRQPHFIMIAPLKPGKTPEDVMKFLAAGEQAQGEPPVIFEQVISTGVLSPDKVNYLTINLKPGTYFTACWIIDPKTHKPHAEIGMTRFITVK